MFLFVYLSVRSFIPFFIMNIQFILIKQHKWPIAKCWWWHSIYERLPHTYVCACFFFVHVWLCFSSYSVLFIHFSLHAHYNSIPDAANLCLVCINRPNGVFVLRRFLRPLSAFRLQNIKNISFTRVQCLDCITYVLCVVYHIAIGKLGIYGKKIFFSLFVWCTFQVENFTILFTFMTTHIMYMR